MFPHPTSSLRRGVLARSGFTLIELLTVIAIIGILFAITITSVGAARATANRMKCASNMRQLGTAFLLHSNEKGRFPNAGHAAPFSNWDIDLRPFLGIDQPFESWTAEAGVRDRGAEARYEAFRCSVDGSARPAGAFAQSYSMPGWICNAFGAYTDLGATWPADRGAPSGAIQNPSRTVLLVENLQAAREAGRSVGQWANSLGDSPELDPARWAHDRRTVLLFADGHVENLSVSSLAPGLLSGGQINPAAWRERYGRMR